MAVPPLPSVGGMLFGGGGSPGMGSDPGSPVTVGQGKNSRQQHLTSPHSGVKSTLASGDPLSRSMGHYGKGHSFSAASSAPALQKFKGGGGGIRRIRGGLGPGRQGQAGPATDYSMKTADTE